MDFSRNNLGDRGHPLAQKGSTPRVPSQASAKEHFSRVEYWAARHSKFDRAFAYVPLQSETFRGTA